MPEHSRYILFEHGIQARNLLMTTILLALFTAYMIGVLIDTLYPGNSEKLATAAGWLYWGSLAVVVVWFGAVH